MAKKLTEEDLVLNVLVNGNQGKRELGELSRFIKDTTREVGKLESQERRLALAGKQNTQEYKDLTAAIRQKSDAIEQARGKMVKLVQHMDVSSMSMTELKASAVQLKAAMDKSVPGSERWNIFKDQLEVVNNRIDEVREQSKQTGSALERMISSFNKYIGVIVAGIGSFMAAISGLKKAVEDFAEFDDQMGSVQKTTGLTKDEVKALNEELKKINTRTTQEDLLGLGRIGGKLGIAKEDLEGFVKATDQITVALNEDLGGNVEETVNQVGKLVDIFKIKGEFGVEQALLKTGSAINDLGAAGTANEEKIVDFTNRVAGIAPSAGISIQNVLGLAATLDSLAQSTEVSGTTYANIIPDMFRNTGTYARVAGMDLKAFTELLNKDANEAFIRVLEGIKGNNAGMAEMTKRLDDLGVDGARSVSVLSTLANNTQLLREQQDLSNQSFAAGTSLTKEYNTMNSTAKAELEKSQKQLHLFVIELGERLYPAQTAVNTLLGSFTRILSVLVGFLFDHWKAIVTVSSAVAIYNAVVTIQNALSKEGIILRNYEIAVAKLKVFWDNAMTGSMHLLSAAYLVARGEIAAAKAEMVMFNTVTKLNPIALLIAAIGAAVVAITLYTKKLTEAERLQRLINDIQAQAQKNTVEEKARIDLLVKAIDNENLSKQNRLTAIGKLRDIMPEYLKGYSDEEILAGKAKEAVKDYIRVLESRARADAALQKITDLDKQKADVEQKLKDGYKASTMWDRLVAGFNARQGKSTSQAFAENLKSQLAEIDKQKKGIIESFEKDLNKQITTPPKIEENNNNGGGNYESEKDAKERKKREHQEAIERERQRKEDILKENASYQQRLKNAGLFNLSQTLMTSEQLEQLRALEGEHQEKIKAINDKADKVTIAQTSSALNELQKRQAAQEKYREKLINPMNELIEQENEANKIRLENAGLTNVSLEKLQEDLLIATKNNNQKEIESLQQKIKAKEILEGIHQAKLNQIDAKLMQDEIDKRQRAYETELADLKIRNNVELSEVKTLAEAKKLLQNTLSPLELNGIRTLNDAKKALRKQNQAEEIALTQRHMEELLKILKDTMSSGDLEGINLSDKILSKEEKELLEKKILEVKNALAGLKNPTEGMSDDLRSKELDKVDLLGFTGSDWDTLFQNLRAGEVGIADISTAVHGLVNTWSMYNQFVEAGERKQLQQFQANTNQKKNALKKQLDSGKINQEKYNQAVEALDAELDQKKAEFDYKEAKRNKTLSLVNALMNTAIGITAALTSRPPNIPLSIAVGVIGAAQAAIIAKQPLPEVPGKEDGGPFDDPDNRRPPFMTVSRSQDGKTFNATIDPKKRGFVSRPTVLVGESGREFVVNDAGVSNPTIAPVLSMIDTAQRNGTISTLNLEQIMAERSGSYTRVPGRATGGTISSTGSGSGGGTPSTPATDPAILDLLEKNAQAIQALNNRLQERIQAEVVLLGKNGFYEQDQQYKDLESKNNL